MMFGNVKGWKASLASFLGPGKMTVNSAWWPRHIITIPEYLALKWREGLLRSQWSLKSSLSCAEEMPGWKWGRGGECRAGELSRHLRGCWSGRMIKQEADHQLNSRHLHLLAMTRHPMWHKLTEFMPHLTKKTLKWLRKNLGIELAKVQSSSN